MVGSSSMWSWVILAARRLSSCMARRALPDQGTHSYGEAAKHYEVRERDPGGLGNPIRGTRHGPDRWRRSHQQVRRFLSAFPSMTQHRSRLLPLVREKGSAPTTSGTGQGAAPGTSCERFVRGGPFEP